MHAHPNYQSGQVQMGTQPQWSDGERRAATQNSFGQHTARIQETTLILWSVPVPLWVHYNKQYVHRQYVGGVGAGCSLWQRQWRDCAAGRGSKQRSGTSCSHDALQTYSALFTHHQEGHFSLVKWCSLLMTQIHREEQTWLQQHY